jgi:hypothetical protein
VNDEDLLGFLAMRFRNAGTDAIRQDVAQDYAKTVKRLIASGGLKECLPPGDMLPNNWMPRSYFEHFKG